MSLWMEIGERSEATASSAGAQSRESGHPRGNQLMASERTGL